MATSTPLSKSELMQRVAGTGQEHILDAYDSLTPEQQLVLTNQFLGELGGVEVKHLNNILRESLEHLTMSQISSVKGGCDAEVIEPPKLEDIVDLTNPKNKSTADAFEKRGLEVLRAGQGAVIILAGGSGTRLGVSYPKGLLVCETLAQQKSLFQLHSEKILHVQRRVEKLDASQSQSPVRIPLLLMTSPQNHTQTVDFFESHGYFGLDKEQVHFFQQTMLPCFEEGTGKILMETPYSMCLSPGGNGGIYESLVRKTASSEESLLDRMEKQGVCFFQITTVDNILSKVGDPVFYGFSAACNAHVAVKTMPKVSDDEKVGVFARRNGHWGVVEYTEIGDARAAEKDLETGERRFNCANIVSHSCSLAFMKIAAEVMKFNTQFHAAKKKISNTVHGTVNGVKLEAFIFDLFRFADDEPLREQKPNGEPRSSGAAAADGGTHLFGILQVHRHEEFSAIKNADDVSHNMKDSPYTAAAALHRLHTSIAIAALENFVNESAAGGNNLVEEEQQQAATALSLLTKEEVQVEISPLIGNGLIGVSQQRAALVQGIMKASEGAPNSEGKHIALLLSPDEAQSSAAHPSESKI